MNEATLPQQVSRADVVFGARALELMPAYDEIPEDFRRCRGDARKWVKFQRDWFFAGLPKDVSFIARDGIDARAAFYHLRAIQGSWEPKHEHKEAAVAYLASLWFEDVPGGAA